MVVDCNLVKRKWLTSFGRKRGKNFNPDGLNALNHYVMDDPTKITTKFHLEIGFGYGEHILSKALLNPGAHYIGCEVYLNGISKLLRKIRTESVKNISIWPHDARILLEQLPKNIIERAYILLPDPWPKRRNHKRRLINNDFLLLLADKMQQCGKLIVATDDFGYAKWIEQVILNMNLKYSKEKPQCMSIETRYQARSIAAINWFQCHV